MSNKKEDHCIHIIMALMSLYMIFSGFYFMYNATEKERIKQTINSKEMTESYHSSSW